MKQLVTCGIVFALFLVSSLTFGSVKTYQFPDDILRSDKYEVTVKQGNTIQKAFVHISECPEQKYPLEKILPLLYDRTFSWTGFEFADEPVEVTVTKLFGEAALDVTISPKKYGILPESFDGHTVRFIMKKPEYVSVRFHSADNTDEYSQIKHGLMIFADEPETDIPQLNGKTVVKYAPDETMYGAEVIYFGPGVYDLTKELPNGVLPLHDNQSVYLHSGAYIYGGITAPSTYNVKVYGRGVIDGQRQLFRYPGLPQLVELEPWNHRTNVHRGGHATVEGITFLHSYKHNCAIGPNSFLKDLKFIAWTVNSDGIRNGDNCVIDHVFMKVSDDHLYAFSNSLITNSIFWPMWNGAILQLSWGNYGGGGTRFVNNIVINPEYNQLWANNGIIASMARPHAQFSDILIQDLTIEGDINALANLHYSTFENSTDKWTGYIKNITFRNIDIQGRLIQNNQQQDWYDTIPPDIRFDITPETPVKKGFDYYKGYKDKAGNMAKIHHVVYENVKVNGVYITEENHKDYVRADAETTSDIRFIRTMNFDDYLSHNPGLTRSNDYLLDGKGAGSLPTHAENPLDPKNYGWLTKGDACMFTIDIPENGKFKLRVSLGHLIHAARVNVYIDNQLVIEKLDIVPKTDDGNNYIVSTSINAIELSRGNHTIRLEVLKGFCIPDYFELSKIDTQNDEQKWKADEINMGVTQTFLKYNSREAAKINSDERGPETPLDFNELHVIDFKGQSYIEKQSAVTDHYLDISALRQQPYFALFTNNSTFWIGKAFVK
jgi:hypothetical protein